jgi:hypothetical protein
MFGKNGDKELVAEIQKLEGTKDEIQNRKISKVKDSRELVLSYLCARHLLDSNDPFFLHLQGEIEKVKKSGNEEADVWEATYKEKSKLLRNLTEPVIKKGVELFRHELSHAKVVREVLSKNSGKPFGKPTVTLSTNERAVFSFQVKINNGIETLRGMTLRPIEEIEAFVAATLKELRAIDLSVNDVAVVDEFLYESQSFATKPA